MIKRKIKIILNVLLHYKKYEKLVGETGVVYSFEYENFKKPYIIWFPKNNEKYCFSLNEFKQIGGQR